VDAAPNGAPIRNPLAELPPSEGIERNHTTMTITPDTLVQRWTDPAARPLFKGSLIDDTGCCCAQGDALRCAGWTDEKLRETDQAIADREVATLLGISLAESILLRNVNDKRNGCPQDVFLDRGKILGPHHALWTAFARHIDTLDAAGWKKVTAAWTAAWTAAGTAARDAAWAAAWTAAWDAAGDAAGAAAWTAAGAAARDAAWAAAWAAAGTAAWTAAGDAAGDAAGELIGWSKLKEPFFLRFFFDDPAAWVASVEGGAACA
jgi:hypothetical protein